MAKNENDKNNKNNNDSGYEVGYGKPPKSSQFKKGQSGNSRGRPVGTNNFKTDVQSLLRSRVRVKKDGKTKMVSSQEATLLRLVDQALGKGNLRAIERLLELSRSFNDEDPMAADGDLGEGAREILDGYVKRMSLNVEDDEDEIDDEEGLQQ